MSTLYLCFLILLICSGCSSASHVIPIDVPAETIETAIQDAHADPLFEDTKLLSPEWWLLFQDSQLTEFIQKAFSRNPTLQSVQTEILAATYHAASVESSLYPYVSLGADLSRQKLSKTGVIPFSSGPTGSGTPVIAVPATPGGTGGIPAYFTLYETELNLRYTFDFWNKNRNTLRAALGQVQANIAEEAFARLQLGIALAKVYYALQIDYHRQEIAQALIHNRSTYFDLIQKRVAAQIDNALSLQVAESNLVDARDLLLQIQGDTAVQKYQLMAYMAGSFDEAIQSVDVTQHALPKVPLPQDLPLNLLSQRSDIVAQLWVIESAGWQIEVAKAGFYPDFNLTAFFGFQTIHFAELFKWPSRYFNVDPAVSLPIFDGGRLAANLHSSEINYDLAILEYNRLVLNAAKEVLDAIAILRNRWQRLKEFELKLDYQSEIYRLTHLRTAHSLSNRLDELTSEGNKLLAQDQELLALGNTIQAILELIQALGGGYDNCEGSP